jgi:hypothetical protein
MALELSVAEYSLTGIETKPKLSESDAIARGMASPQEIRFSDGLKQVPCQSSKKRFFTAPNRRTLGPPKPLALRASASELSALAA